MKNKILAFLTVTAPIAVFAEGESGSTISTPKGILDAAKQALDTLMGDALPVVGAIVVAGLTLWGAFKLLRLVMKAFGFGTSR